MDSKYIHFLTIKDNILKQRGFIMLNNAFKAAGIPMVPIKGIALLYELGKYAETRPMCDIDILVRKDNVDKSKDLLLSLGYKVRPGRFSENYYCTHYHHLPFYSKYLIELHWNLSPPRPNNILLPELWKRIRHIKSGEDTITLLSPEDTIISLALHLRRFNDPFSLKYIRDINKILEKHAESLDWQYILKYSRLNRLNSLIYYSLISIKINLTYPISSKIPHMFYPGVFRASLLKSFINMCPFNSVGEGFKPSPTYGGKRLAYLFLRFLLYDRLWDFMKFIILIPIEEFARFYCMKFPSKRASIIYRLRFIIAPFYLRFKTK